MEYGFFSSPVRVALAAAFAVTAVLLVLATADRSGRLARQSGVATSALPVAGAAAAPEVATLSATDPDPTVTEGDPAPDPTAVTPQPAAPASACERSHLLVSVNRELPVRSSPGGSGRLIGRVPSRSKYLGANLRIWVHETDATGNWGRVDVPWVWPQSDGWINLRGLERSQTTVAVRASLRRREIRVTRGCDTIFRTKAAIGASGSPTPKGRFYVTDMVAVPASQPYFGSYAFGMSTQQPRPPRGWRGGNQMAIHGTNSPGSIGTPASAGCLRVSEPALDRLRELIEPGTPVIIQA